MAHPALFSDVVGNAFTAMALDFRRLVERRAYGCRNDGQCPGWGGGYTGVFLYTSISDAAFQEFCDFELRERGAGPLADPDPAGAPFLLCPAVV